MRYFIKNKDRAIGSFVWKDAYGITLPILTENISLPWFISDNLAGWLESRTPPKHRQHIATLLSSYALTTAKSVIDFSKGLSLTDTLWITPEPHTPWASANLFDNLFNEDIADITLTGRAKGRSTGFSAEFTTDGALPKCWVRDGSEIFLKKGGTSGAANTGNEPYSEAMVSQILDVLDYPHVPYTVERFRGAVVSSCPLFTSQEVMLLPMHTLVPTPTFDSVTAKCIELGIAHQLFEHFIIDYLTCNTDRHLGNFGVLMNADDYSYISMAPIYDNGLGMLPYWTSRHDVAEYIAKHVTAFGVEFEEIAKRAKAALGTHNVERLIGFKFDRTKLLDFPDSRIDILEAVLQQRVRYYLDL